VIDWNNFQTGNLGETATYASRVWVWFAGGLLQIECDDKHGRRTVVQYQVEDLGMLPGLMGREFKLTKWGVEPAEYRVAIGALSRCSCMAGQTRGKEPEPCKHLAAMRAIEARGLLDGEVLDNERSGLAFEDRPGEPTAYELDHSPLESLSHGTR